MNFGEYATTWIEEHPGLRPKTIELYRYLLRCHLLPTFRRCLYWIFGNRSYAAGARNASTLA